MKTPSWTFVGDCAIKADVTTYHFWSQTKNETLPILISLFMHRVFSNEADIYVTYCTPNSANFFLIIINFFFGSVTFFVLVDHILVL